ncbi:MAG: peptidyl-prolyl cis-trans isomerase [Rubripirellula sp.]
MKHFWSSLIREPLVHFTVLAAAILAANAWFAKDERETIAVSKAMVDDLIRIHQELQPRPVTESLRQELVESFVEDEILIREAYRRGLDRDGIVRKHLTMKMRALLAEDVDEPTSEELRRYFLERQKDYESPSSVVFEHIFYPAEVSPDEGLLEELRSGAKYEQFGQSLGTLGRGVRPYAQKELAFFVDSAFAEQVFAITTDEWTGPIESSRGTHFVRVVEKTPARPAEFKEMEAYLREDWEYAQIRQGISDKIDELRDQYNILVEPASEAKP